MVQSRPRALRSLAVAGVLASILIAVGQGPVSATHRTGTAVKGSAFGLTYNAGLFGGRFQVGPTPFVKLSPNASNSPQTGNEETFHDGVITAGSRTLTSASANFTTVDISKSITGAGIPTNATIESVNTGDMFTPASNSITMNVAATATATGVTFTIVNRTVAMQFGPGKIFSAEGITVQTSGTVGPTWSVTSSADVQDVNRTRVEIFGEDRKDCCRLTGFPEGTPGDFLPDVPGSPTMTRPLTDIASTCTASGAGVSGSTTITNGWLYTDNGWYDSDEFYPEPAEGEHDPVKVALPNNPPVGATYTGHLHIGSANIDRYVVVFNEQIVNSGTITVNAAHFYYGYRLESGNLVVDEPSVFKGEMILGQSVCGVPHAAPRADFNGNGTTDVAVFRPSSGTWFIRGGTTAAWGTSGDVPVAGDYDGDGDTDIAVFRPSSGTWFVQGAPAAAWGTSGDVPVPGDYDGDGDTDVAVFRPSTGTWFVRGGTTAAWGTSGDIPVPGDYDGDGDTDVAVFRPSTGTWFVRGGTTAAWGTSGDVPVPGDYDVDGDTDIAVFRPSSGTWFVRGGPTAAWGTSGDVPVPGDYDDDGETDIAVFRPSSGTWFVRGGATTPFGSNGDIPVPVPDAIRRFFFPAP